MDWIILRTKSRHTLTLAASLAQDGFGIWVPIEHRVIHISKTNVRRPIRKAMLPGYVFARSCHLVDLLEASRIRQRRGHGLRDPAHARFWVVRKGDGTPAMILDSGLDDIRRIEARRTPATKAEKALLIGALVRVNSGIAEGVTGLVEKSNHRNTTIRPKGGNPMEFATCILAPHEIHSGQAAIAA